MDLLDPVELTREVAAAVERAAALKAGSPTAMADVVATVIRHLAVRVSAEMSTLRATSAALGEVVGHLPDRLGTIEHRLGELERRAK